MKAKEVMTKQPQCCTPDTNLVTVSRMMINCDCGAIPARCIASGSGLKNNVDR